jgi:GT2 family glycosyltransferase
MQDVQKILISIFHKPGKDDSNFERLKSTFNSFDIFIPEVNYYGNKWREAKKEFIDKDYDSLFVICSDVSLVCGSLIKKIKQYSSDQSIGMYGFGTINNYTFQWLGYDNIHLIKEVPFVEGYCFGMNKKVVKYLELDTAFGYGLDVEIGYKSIINGLKCIIDSGVCINHQFGKSYNNEEATKEYREYLLANPSVHNFLKRLKVPTPI